MTSPSSQDTRRLGRVTHTVSVHDAAREVALWLRQYTTPSGRRPWAQTPLVACQDDVCLLSVAQDLIALRDWYEQSQRGRRP